MRGPHLINNRVPSVLAWSVWRGQRPCSHARSPLSSPSGTGMVQVEPPPYRLLRLGEVRGRHFTLSTLFTHSLPVCSYRCSGHVRLASLSRPGRLHANPPCRPRRGAALPAAVVVHSVRGLAGMQTRAAPEGGGALPAAVVVHSVRGLAGMQTRAAAQLYVMQLEHILHVLNLSGE